MIIIQIEIRNAQRRPSQPAREPPSQSWASPIRLLGMVQVGAEFIHEYHIPVIAQGIVATRPDLVAVIP